LLKNRYDDIGPLLADGATGTNFFDLGLGAGDPPELWNIDQPDKVTTLHSGFVGAGSDIILTNSFGGTRHRLKLHKADDRVHELNAKAAEIALAVAATVDRQIIVAGSVGPTGELIVPLGELTYDDAVEAFTEQMTGLRDGGVDLVWIETMSSAEEIQAAVAAAQTIGIDYAVTASFDTAGHTMMGLSPAAFADQAMAYDPKPAAFGANCGVGAADLLVAVLAMTEQHPDAMIVAKANCGIPQAVGGEIKYTGTPDLMANYAQIAVDAGAKIIGGCCGTTAEHLRSMRDALDGHQKNSRPDVAMIVESLGPMVSAAAADRNSDAADAAAQRRSRRRRRT